MRVQSLDHLVLTVADIDRSIDFYTRYLGMEAVAFGQGRWALRFGAQKINLHQAGAEIRPHAERPTPGSADLCLLLATPLEAAFEALEAAGLALESGLVERTGARGPIRSFYLRDPDGNLIELSQYQE